MSKFEFYIGLTILTVLIVIGILVTQGGKAYSINDEKEVDINTVKGTDIKKVIANDNQRIVDSDRTKDAAIFYMTQDGLKYRAYIDYVSKNGLIVVVKPRNPYLSKDWLQTIVASFRL